MADPIVDVENVSIRFALSSEKIDSMKEYFIKTLRGVISYNEFLALKDISFHMEKGESIGLIGLNGCWKKSIRQCRSLQPSLCPWYIMISMSCSKIMTMSRLYTMLRKVSICWKNLVINMAMICSLIWELHNWISQRHLLSIGSMQKL